MTKKRLKANKPNVKSPSPPIRSKSEDAERIIRAIVEKGKEKGFLTYEEMNNDLPEGTISPASLDSLLATLDEMGVNIIDEADVEKQTGEDFEVSEGEAGKAKVLRDDRILEKEMAGAEAPRA